MSRLHSPLWPDRSIKPAYGSVEIDRSHPLAQGLVSCWLLNEPGGLNRDLTGHGHDVTSMGSCVIDPAYGIRNTGSGSAPGAVIRDVNSELTNLAGTYRFSVVAAIRPITSLVNFSGIINFGGGGLAVHLASDGRIGMLVKSDMTNSSAAGRAAVGTITHVVGTSSAWGIPFTKVYINGVDDTSGTSDYGWGNQAIYEICGSGLSTANTFRGSLLFGQIYSRVLSAAEVLWLYADPYCFLRPVKRRSYGFALTGAATPSWQPRMLSMGVG